MIGEEMRMTTETTVKPEWKWIIDDSRIGPANELVMLMPRMFPDDDDWYFLRAERKIIPHTQVFDTAQAAALAAIEMNRSKIRRLENENRRFLEWYKELEAGAQRKRAQA